MKKILYSSILCTALVACYDKVVAFGSHDNSIALGNPSENMFDGKNELDPIDPEGSSDLYDPEVSNYHSAVLGTLSDDRTDVDDSDSSSMPDKGSDDQDLSKDDTNEVVQRSDEDASKDDADEVVQKSDYLQAFKDMMAEKKDEASSEDSIDKAKELPILTEKDLKESAQMNQKTAEKQKAIADVLMNLSSSISNSTDFSSKNSDEIRELKDKLQKVSNLWSEAAAANSKAAQITGFLAELDELGFEPSQELLNIAKELRISALQLVDKPSKAMIDELGLKLVFKP
jgi:hypothetical protein